MCAGGGGHARAADHARDAAADAVLADRGGAAQARDEGVHRHATVRRHRCPPRPPVVVVVAAATPPSPLPRRRLDSLGGAGERAGETREESLVVYTDPGGEPDSQTDSLTDRRTNQPTPPRAPRPSSLFTRTTPLRPNLRERLRGAARRLTLDDLWPVPVPMQPALLVRAVELLVSCLTLVLVARQQSAPRPPPPHRHAATPPHRQSSVHRIAPLCRDPSLDCLGAATNASDAQSRPCLCHCPLARFPRPVSRVAHSSPHHHHHPTHHHPHTGDEQWRRRSPTLW